jgi:phosphoserine phosphatase
MSFVLIFVAGNQSKPLNPGHLAEVEHFLDEKSIRFSLRPRWLHIHKAADLKIDDKPTPDQLVALRALLDSEEIDIFITPSEARRKYLLVADMDATIVSGETLDELAAFAGLKHQISTITARAMRGELDFKAALCERVAMLKDLPVSTLQDTLNHLTLSPGAETLVKVMRNNGATCVLVSGGFTFFTGAISARAGFHFHHGNKLKVEDGHLTGDVIPPILDKDAKLNFLMSYREKMVLPREETIAIGDGANDLPMLENAGLGLGYQPKPLLLDALENSIIHSDLVSALYIQGYTWQEIEQSLNSGDDSPQGLQ